MTFQITFKNAWTYEPKNPNVRLPVSSLPKDGKGHIHGRLEIIVAGRPLPYLGYFGPDDVCMNEWIKELSEAAAKLKSADNSEHVYHDCEQGQPTFRFERCGNLVFISIITSEFSGAKGLPDWQMVECRLDGFLSAVSTFETQFRKLVLSESPVGGKLWLKSVMKQWA